MLTLHHLETSRSSRIIWLLEALGADYKLVTHKRGPDRRSQADLAAIHPLGKAPAIVDGDLVLVESATILRYIAERHGNRFMPASGTEARARHDECLDYVESSFMPPLMMKLFGLMGGGLPDLLETYSSGEFAKAAHYMGEAVGKGPFLMGAEVTLADMQLSYCLAMAEMGGFLKDQASLAAYWQRLQAEPGFKRMIEVGGPLMLARG